MNNCNYLINEILVNVPGFGPREVGYDCYDDCIDYEHVDYLAEGRVRFFRFGSLIVDVSGEPALVLAAYHDGEDVVLLADIYNLAWNKNILQYPLSMLAEHRERVQFSSDDKYIGLSLVLTLDGSFCYPRNADLREYEPIRPLPVSLYEIDDSASSAHARWLDGLHQFFGPGFLRGDGLAGDLQSIRELMRDSVPFEEAVDRVIDDRLCLGCLNAGRPAGEWGELLRFLPYEICPKCGLVTVDHSAASFNTAVKTAAEELKNTLLRDTTGGQPKKAKRGRKSAVKRLSSSR